MKKTFLLVIVCIFFSVCGYSQLSTNQNPRSFSIKDLDLSNINTIKMAEPNIDYFIEEDRTNDTMFNKIRRSSLIIPIKEDFFEKATHLQISDADIYIIKINIPNAQALNLYSNNFYIPKGGEMYIYNEDYSKVIGGFTSLNNHPSGMFASDYVYGDNMIIEYYQPKTIKEKAKIELSEISYFYRDIENYKSLTKNSEEYGASGSCEVNVNCSEGDNYRNQQRGVCRIYLRVNNYQGGWCSGTLINNTARDKKPYVISAAHCIEDVSNTSYYNQFVFYFNYETSGCSNPATEPTTSNTLTGCSVKAYDNTFASGGSDFWLMLLNNNVPDSYRPYYCGWSRSQIASTNGVGIHHPAGDVKKISTYTTSLVSSQYQTTAQTHWKAVWAQTTNGYGVTEGGSSGSALFNNEGLIVGTLTGGASSCSAATSAKNDLYGKFSYHWNSNGTATERQIATFLDPTNSGVTTLSGMDYTDTTPTSSIANVNQDINSLIVYPNPAKDYFTLSINNNNNATINIIDYSGRIIYSTILPKNQNIIKINTNNIEKGVYIINVISGDNTFSKKLVIE